ncbi:MAG: DUF5691 domain-containing protein [Chloroflexota bacterium]
MDTLHMDAPDTMQLALTGTAHAQPGTTAAGLLLEAGTVRLQKRAGWQPPACPAQIGVAPDEEKPACSAAAQRFLAYILHIDHALLLEWLLLVALAGQHAPHRYLPRLLAIATWQKPLRIYLRHTLGTRGDWLVSQHTSFDWVSATPAISVGKLPTCQHWRDANVTTVLDDMNRYQTDRRLKQDRMHTTLLKQLARYGGIWSATLTTSVMETMLQALEKGGLSNDGTFDMVLYAVAYNCPLELADEVLGACDTLTLQEAAFWQVSSGPNSMTRFRYFKRGRWQELLSELADIFTTRRALHAAINTNPDE